MKKIYKQEEINVDVQTIFNLINSVEDYPNFLPWCTNSKIKSKNDKSNTLEIVADLEIGYSFAKDIYTSEVKFDKKTRTITVNALQGPLKKLENLWVLKKINEKECEITFSINLELKNFLLNKMLSSMFDIGFDKILKSFEKRAKYLSSLN